MTEVRRETDSLGVVEVPADKLWGAQTQRSLEHFSIGHDPARIAAGLSSRNRARRGWRRADAVWPSGCAAISYDRGKGSRSRCRRTRRAHRRDRAV